MLTKTLSKDLDKMDDGGIYMTKKLRSIDIFAGIDMSEEGIEKRLRENYKVATENFENMSYWLPKIEGSLTRLDSKLKIPDTKVIPLNYEKWKWLRSDNYTAEKIKEFNDYLNESLGDFHKDEIKFMKSGIFSNKFEFHQTVVDNPEQIGSQFLDMFYTSMMYGADTTAEVVIREMIQDKENCLRIYEGMPLHTEYRVFYDFDNKKVLGIANYWHPEIMTKKLTDENAAVYKEAMDQLTNDYEAYKKQVSQEVASFVNGCQGLSGKWSVDVMKNADEFWLIDMARMEKSALIQQMDIID